MYLFEKSPKLRREAPRWPTKLLSCLALKFSVLGFGVSDRVSGLGLGALGLGRGAWGLWIVVCGLVFGVFGLGVWDLGFKF